MSTAVLTPATAKPANQLSREELAESLIELLIRYIARETPDAQRRYTIRDKFGSPFGFFTPAPLPTAEEFDAEMVRRMERAKAGEVDVIEAEEFLASIRKDWGFPTD